MSSPEFKDWWKTFSATGDICPVRLGMSREELKTILGGPDDVGGTSRKHPTPAIWKYDNLEFHFELGANGPLWLIYSEAPSVSIRVINERESQR